MLQLSDIAVRAMSLGINDPTTAQHAVGNLASQLSLLAEKPIVVDRPTRDGDGEPRVWEARRSLPEYLAGR